MRLFVRCLLSAAVLTAFAAPAGAEPIKFARHPHVAHGKLVFAYHGDIWIANADGTNPSRLTAHVARDTFPRFSPDGKWVAFTSDRFGNADVFVVPATGGEPKQLTFATTADLVHYWTPDGKSIVFSTSRGTSPWRSPLYSVPMTGGLPSPLPMDGAVNGMIKQDGTMVAYNRMGGAYWRKGNKGNRADDIWVQDLRTKKITQLTDTDMMTFRDHVEDRYPMWGADGQIYFASERDDIFNIWKIAPTGGQPTQVTRHREDGVQFPSISPDGTTIAYENDFEIWTLPVAGGQPSKVTIDLAFDAKLNLIEFLPVNNRIQGFSPSPDGDYAAVDNHGEIFIVPTEANVGERTQVTSSSRRDRGETFSPDGTKVAYLSDETREEEVWVYDRAAGTRRQLSTHPSFKSIEAWSPDSKRIAWTGNNRLFMADVDSGQSTEIGYHEAGGYQVSDFSPDGKWLVYTKRDDDQNADVWVMELASKREFNITANPFQDTAGQFMPDGKRILFLSNRDGGTNHLFVVSLERMTEDPDDPLVRERERKAQRDRRPAGAQPGGAAPTGAPAAGAQPAGAQPAGGRNAAPPATPAPDTNGIARRAIQITTGTQGAQTYFTSNDGRTIFFRSSDERGPGLFQVGIDGSDRRRLSDGPFLGLTPTSDRRKVFYTQSNELWQMEMAGERRKTRVPVEATVRVDRREEWAQIFDEAWRVMKYRFYDENMHGRDWNAIRARYEPLLRYVGENQDVYDLANEMIGELNASHTGVSGPQSNSMPDAYQTRYTGFEMDPDGDAFRITHIYRDGPADKEWVNLKTGDYVLAIDGTRLKPGDNYYELLNHSLNDYVNITVSSSKPSGGKATDERTERVRAVNSLNNIKYEEWVEKNREFVERESKGQIAYVHIRAMNQPSLARFQNEIDRFSNARGIIVDIRYNGGGNIDQQLLDILERRPYQYWNNRWGGRTWGRRPRQAIAGPKVMLINYRSGSDSEVTPMGFRDLGLGRIVGNPTAAAVIATGSYPLINGGSIRTPGSLVVTYDPERPNNYGINLENYGVAPDVFVENTPEDELNGFDRELKAAVDEALKMLASGLWQYRSEQQKQ
ncbi:MAG TPA: S41 family peptidase [Vicinamibacterales bacterium]|nr:S41 family peptidase [Vicinamibacterales bacterium]